MTSALRPIRSLGGPLLLLYAAVSRGQDDQDLRCPRSGRANNHDLVAPPHLPGGKPGSGPGGSAVQPTPAEGRSSVSIEQKENLDAIMRQSAFPLDEAAAALDRAGQLQSAHLAAAEHVTA
jgi:hypothetical protein